MNKQLDIDMRYLKLLSEEINAFKNLTQEQKVSSAVLQTCFFWCLDRLTMHQFTKHGTVEYKRLQSLLHLCKSEQNDNEILNRAAIEISELAPPNDNTSIEALSRLLKHENKYIRISACQSIGRIGGNEAKRVLQELLNSKDSELSNAAKDALCYQQMGAIADNLRFYMEQVEILHKEKQDLKMLLSEKYTAKILLLCSGVFFLGFMMSLFAWYRFGLIIVHPSLAFLGCLVSVGFIILAAWRYKCTQT